MRTKFAMKIDQVSGCAHYFGKIEVQGAHISAPLWCFGAGGTPVLTSGQCFSDIYSFGDKEVTVGNGFPSGWLVSIRASGEHSP
ncbi:hypothetical protein PUR34_22185 [Streptomyces sp. JV185]|uniref:hypothetical protein n=1 Tax=Streptomyces sp. JV185 TaxID=858638 RepID=UPI002E762849|nr:hypothetical protein [Streptomyces sp. JV185]MEE1770772.1 hypothetical protein [Streptomyces sp. JV185]